MLQLGKIVVSAHQITSCNALIINIAKILFWLKPGTEIHFRFPAEPHPDRNRHRHKRQAEQGTDNSGTEIEIAFGGRIKPPFRAGGWPKRTPAGQWGRKKFVLAYTKKEGTDCRLFPLSLEVPGGFEPP